MRRTRLFTLCGAMAVMALAGCAQDTDDTLTNGAPVTTEPATPPPATPTESIGPTPAANAAAGNLTLMQTGQSGPYLADDAGSALYMLEGDTDGSGCVDTCLEAWPPMLVSDAQPTAGAGLRGELVASIQRPDGTVQITYNNHPLYRYAADRGAGRTAGRGVSDQWGQWHLVTPEGEAMASGDS